VFTQLPGSLHPPTQVATHGKQVGIELIRSVLATCHLGKVFTTPAARRPRTFRGVPAVSSADFFSSFTNIISHGLYFTTELVRTKKKEI